MPKGLKTWLSSGMPAHPHNTQHLQKCFPQSVYVVVFVPKIHMLWFLQQKCGFVFISKKKLPKFPELILKQNFPPRSFFLFLGEFCYFLVICLVFLGDFLDFSVILFGFFSLIYFPNMVNCISPKLLTVFMLKGFQLEVGPRLLVC